MNKYILIDLEDTITIHEYKDRIKNVMLKWLEYNKVTNPIEIYNDCRFKNRESRLKLLNITMEEYKNWYNNFSDVEFNTYYNNYKNGKISIKDDAFIFIQKCNLPLILVSNSSPKWIDYILQEYNLKDYFRYIFKRDYIVDDIKKPDSKVIDIIKKDLKDEISDESIVVGDSFDDYRFAQNCNLKFISMYNNFDDCKVCKNFNELLSIIHNFETIP